MSKAKLKLIIASIAALSAELFVPGLSGVAHGIPAQFSFAVLRWDSHNASAVSGITICTVPSATEVSAANATWHAEVVFPSLTLAQGTDFTQSATLANWAIDTNFAGEGQIGGKTINAWPGIGFTGGSTNLGHADDIHVGSGGHAGTTLDPLDPGIVDFPYSSVPGVTLTAGNLYCFHVTSTIATPSLTNSTAITTIDGTVRITDATVPNIATRTSLQLATGTKEETNYATSIITNDQISVSAVVPPNFRFSIASNVDTFGSTGRLDPTIVNRSNGVNFTVATNAKGGWIAWAKDFDRGLGAQGLNSATANYTIATGPGTLLDGLAETLIADGAHEGYLLDADIATASAGGCQIGNNVTEHTDNDYNGDELAGTPTYGGLLSKVFQPVAECLGSPPATSNGDVIKLTEAVVIANSTPAGSDYTDIITVVAAGEF